MFRPHVYRLLWSAALAHLVLVGFLSAEEPVSYTQQARDRYDQAQELRKSGQLLEAIRAYQEAIGQGMEKFPRAHLYLASSYLDLRKYDEAIGRFSRFIDEFGLERSCRY
jgi:TolA-binding protein